MKKSLNKIGLLTTAAFFGFAGQAFASTATTTPATTIKAENYSTSTIANKKVSATSTPGSAAAGIVGWQIPPTAGVSNLLIGDKIVLTLTNGKWDVASMTNNQPALYDSAITVGATGGITGTSFAGGSTCALSAAQNVLTCSITGKNSAVGTITSVALSSAVTYDLSATVAGKPVTVDMVVNRPSVLAGGAAIEKHNTGATKKPVTLFNTSVGLISGGKVTAAPNVTAQVSKSYKQILTTGTGAVSIPASGTGTNFAAFATLAGAQAANATGVYLLSFSGVPTAATSLTSKANRGLTITQSDAAGTAKAAGATTAGSDFFLDGLGNAYGTVAPGTLIDFAAGDYKIGTNGTTAIAAGTMKVGITYVPGINDKFVAHTLLAPTNLVTIKRNGTAFSLNRMGSTSTIRLSNQSAGTAAGTIVITAKDAAGANIANTGLAAIALPTVVASGKTVTISGQSLMQAFPGAINYDFVVESDDVLASQRQAVAGVGILNTVYRSGTQTGGAL